MKDWLLGLWRHRVTRPLREAATRSPRRAALALTLGTFAAVWPQIGTPPLVGWLLAWLLGRFGVLRQQERALVCGVSLVFAPLQYLFMLPFLRVGEWLAGAEPFQTSVPDIIAVVAADPVGSFAVLGAPLLHAILGWLTAGGLGAAGLYPLFLRLSGKMDKTAPTG